MTRTITTESRDVLAKEFVSMLTGMSMQPENLLPVRSDLEISQATLVYALALALKGPATAARGGTEPDFDDLAAVAGVLIEWMMQLHLAVFGAQLNVKTTLIGVGDNPENKVVAEMQARLAELGGGAGREFSGVMIDNASEAFCRTALALLIAEAHAVAPIQVEINAENADRFRDAYERAKRLEKDIFEFEGQAVDINYARYLCEWLDNAQKGETT